MAKGLEASEKLALSVGTAAELLDLSRPTMYELIHIEGFPVVWIGNKPIINKVGLQRWLDEQEGNRFKFSKDGTVGNG